MNWDNIGCDYGEELTVVTVDGRSFTGILTDFEIDFDGSLGGDCICLDIDGRPPTEFNESAIAEMYPARGDTT